MGRFLVRTRSSWVALTELRESSGDVGEVAHTARGEPRPAHPEFPQPRTLSLQAAQCSCLPCPPLPCQPLSSLLGLKPASPLSASALLGPGPTWGILHTGSSCQSRSPSLAQRPAQPLDHPPQKLACRRGAGRAGVGPLSPVTSHLLPEERRSSEAQDEAAVPPSPILR